MEEMREPLIEREPMEGCHKPVRKSDNFSKEIDDLEMAKQIDR